MPPQSAPALLTTVVEDSHIKDQIDRVKNFDVDYPEDIWVPKQRLHLLEQIASHLERVQNFVGHANFSLLSFDNMLRYARNYSAIGEFNKHETDFLDELFHTDASLYGFMGNKVIARLTARIAERDTIKIPYSGNYLFRGESQHLYNKLQTDVGQQLVLTSGIRGVVKQMHLFLAKAVHTNGNLSRASRSLAPPGHSYHGIGDFDVGQINLGAANFTNEFAETDVFKRLVELGYVHIRYPTDNQVGVRYEPWHIKVV